MDDNPIEVNWTGPFEWPGIDDGSASFPDFHGIYLWTVAYLHGGYLIYAAGITRRPMKERFREHTRAHLNGIYTLFDMDAMRQGIRREIWHGFWTKKRSAEKQQEYDRRKVELEAVVRTQLTAFRVFAAIVDTRPRLLERLEAAIMNNLYDQPAPFSDIPDRGMMLAPRWQSEMPIVIRNNSSVVLHGLPDRLVI